VNTTLGHKEGVSSKNASMFFALQVINRGKISTNTWIQGWWLNNQIFESWSHYQGKLDKEFEIDLTI
jgi:hypothetical protein